jgi:ABC-2 type transport system permease protein
MIAALLQKDVKLFFRNQFNLVITVLSLAIFIIAYLFLPDEVDQTLDIAVYAEDGLISGLPDVFPGAIEIRSFETEEALIEAVDNGDVAVGLVLTRAVLNGDAIPVYYAPGTSESVRETFDSVLTMGLNVGDAPMLTNVSMTTEVLGPQALDAPTPMRDRLLPALVLVIYAVEMMGLAGLIVEEIENDTARGVLTTPLSLGQFFSAKAIMGVGLAVSQALALLAIIGVLFEAPLAIAAILLASGLLISGVAFVIASVSEDYMAVMGWSILFILAMLIPALTLVAPGLASDAVRLIPSYFFVDALHQTINLGGGFGDITTHLVTLTVISLGLLALGGALLRRRLS